MTKLPLRIQFWLGPWLCGLVLATPSPCFAAPDPAVQSGHAKNPQAVVEVQAGKRAEANAAWWGFDEEDATEAIQAAIRSGAKRVIVPNVGKDWIVRPLQLASDQELVLEPGVVITAHTRRLSRRRRQCAQRQ